MKKIEDMTKKELYNDNVTLTNSLIELKKKIILLENENKKLKPVKKIVKKKFVPNLMFCYQCEQTTKESNGCVDVSDCGKTPGVAALQDLLIYTVKGLCVMIKFCKDNGINVDDASKNFINESLFATLTNVNFDASRFVDLLEEVQGVKNKVEKLISNAGKKLTFKSNYEKIAVLFNPKKEIKRICNVNKLVDLEDLFVAKEFPYGLGSFYDNYGKDSEDIHSLKSTLLYGVKGLAAYADHAHIFGLKDEKIYDFVMEALIATLNDNTDVNYWVKMLLKCGEVNLRAMELLDKGNTETYGTPKPTEVFLGAKKGPCILVSGHDLKDLKMILEQTEGEGINVYTHGELLPAHGYPELKKHKHLIGNYGGAWFRQKSEFKKFPGPIVMTTNCILEPQKSYKENIFTTGRVGWEEVTHIEEEDDGTKDFADVIDCAKDMGGFKEDVAGDTVLTGFARQAVLGVADKVIAGVKSGAIKHIFLVGGCDGAKDQPRSYFAEIVKKIPKNCLILTLACGKYRFYREKREPIGGIPTLLDVGQCNDAYSAIQIAVALAGAFKCGVNDLPLSIILSWFEQKAVAILLTLLHLNIQNIRIGPSLPEFFTKNVLDLIVKNYAVKPVGDPDKDLKEILKENYP